MAAADCARALLPPSTRNAELPRMKLRLRIGNMRSSPQSCFLLRRVCGLFGRASIHSAAKSLPLWKGSSAPHQSDAGPAGKTSLRLRPALKHRLEIRAGALRFEPGGFGQIAEPEIAVDQAGAMMVPGRDIGGGERFGIGFAFVAQGIVP